MNLLVTFSSLPTTLMTADEVGGKCAPPRRDDRIDDGDFRVGRLRHGSATSSARASPPMMLVMVSCVVQSGTGDDGAIASLASITGFQGGRLRRHPRPRRFTA